MVEVFDRKIASHVGLRLGKPIPLNSMYRAISMGGRTASIKSSAYRKWTEEQGKLLEDHKPPRIPGPYVAYITLPENYRGDVDGGVKCWLDLLQNHGVTDNDKNCVEIRVKKGAEKNITGIMLITKRSFDEDAL